MFDEQCLVRSALSAQDHAHICLPQPPPHFENILKGVGETLRLLVYKPLDPALVDLVCSLYGGLPPTAILQPTDLTICLQITINTGTDHVETVEQQYEKTKLENKTAMVVDET
jgi:hypothetical protein